MNKSSALAGMSVVAAFAVVFAGMAASQDIIAKRKDIMKGVGGGTKTATEMIKGDKPYDAAAAAEAANKIATTWGEFSKSFPKGTETGGETTAGPKIWETHRDFDEKGQKMAKDAALAASEAAKGPDAFKTAFGEVTKNCKGCHTDYRIQKK
jgi:cytochrome c556